MKPCSTMIATLIVGLMCAGSLMGQSPAFAPGSAQAAAQSEKKAKPVPVGDVVARLTRALSLSVAQQQQVRGIFENEQNEFKQLKLNASLPPVERKQRMLAIRTNTRASIRALLDDDQKAKYEQMLAGGPVGPAPGLGNGPAAKD